MQDWSTACNIVNTLGIRNTLWCYARLLTTSALEHAAYFIRAASKQSPGGGWRDKAAPLSRVCCTDFRTSWNVFIWDSSHRFVPVCFPVLLLAAPPEPHCADCFFLGAGAFALPLKAFVASSLFRWTSPAGSDGLTSLLNIRGWYSDAHCCGGDRSWIKQSGWL